MTEGSYRLLEVGMRVVGGNGDSIGHITDVVADENIDIFRGIVISTGLFSHNVFVSGEHVTAVSDESATIDLTHNQLSGLPNAADLAGRNSD